MHCFVERVVFDWWVCSKLILAISNAVKSMSHFVPTIFYKNPIILPLRELTTVLCKPLYLQMQPEQQLDHNDLKLNLHLRALKAHSVAGKVGGACKPGRCLRASKNHALLLKYF